MSIVRDAKEDPRVKRKVRDTNDDLRMMPEFETAWNAPWETKGIPNPIYSTRNQRRQATVGDGQTCPDRV